MKHYKIDIERAERNLRRLGHKGRYVRTQQEVADIIGVTRPTLIRWEKVGIIQYPQDPPGVVRWPYPPYDLIVIRPSPRKKEEVTIPIKSPDGRISYRIVELYDVKFIINQLKQKKDI